MEKHGIVLSKNHAYALFCLCFPLSLLSFIEIEVLQVILLIWCLKSVKCGSEFTYRLWGQASYWIMFITRNMFLYPLFVVGAIWFENKRLGRSRKSQVSHKGLYQTVLDFSVDLIHVQNKWSCLNVVNQWKVRVSVVNPICPPVAVYLSTIKAGTSKCLC